MKFMSGPFGIDQNEKVKRLLEKTVQIFSKINYDPDDIWNQN